MPDRRAFPRIPASALPGLTAFAARCPELLLLDISEGGALIETPVRWTPGQREVFVLRGDSAVRVVGWIVRAEIARLTPFMSYRSAVRFGAPVTLRALGCSEGFAGSDLPEGIPVESTQRLFSDAPPELRQEFTRLVRGLPSVRAVRVSYSLRAQQGTESVHFAVPKSSYGDRRMLQVFFHPETSPTADEFTQLRYLAVLASGLPDIDIVRSDSIQ
jgi:hypothetical protein